MKILTKKNLTFIGSQKCPIETKAHLTRCDMFYKCITLPSDKHMWITKTCPNGLIYDLNYNSCVVAGESEILFVIAF